MQLKPSFLVLPFLLCLGRVCVGKEILLIISCPQQAEINCRALRESLLQQQQQQQLNEAIPTDYDYDIKVHILQELFNYWTLLDALPYLRGQTRLLNTNTDWIIWCQHNTHVPSLRGLLEQLHRRDAQELAYYGHALYDAEATIVHHFANYKDPTWFPYPMLSAGVVFTGALLRSLVELVAVNAPNATRHSEFAIDAAHELARFIFDNLAPAVPNADDDDGKTRSSSSSSSRNNINIGKRDVDFVDMLQRKIILKSADYICPWARVSPAWSLASSETTAKKQAPASEPLPCFLHAKPEVAAGNAAHCVHTTGAHIYFAIKTCAKFHKERIPIIERTWAPDAMRRKYYSDVADAGIPTISTGQANVPTGHCAKTLAILQLSLKDINEQADIRWLMLVDDDTLLSVPRLSALLSCYNHTAHMYLGERYGYRLYAPDGFNYHTGGAGIVLSVPLVRLMVEHCSCPAASAPDDMILGYCLQALGVPAVHVPGLHQARPQDYAPELLQLNAPISFHKYWHTSPEHTYTRWLGGTLANASSARHASRPCKDRLGTPLQLHGRGLLQLANMGAGWEGGTSKHHLDL
ncbi:beta-1,3-glucosyltransferase [Drosophila novamexicana]|uniref:beta-1,3-glucosyltransferase n=1 Tax=Drosophila novamexicana TaxID=47314 RepID=UPI0011E5CA89|nr:beta-1,3-glucosyltransferase [Drosophila novamexicana]